MAAAAQAPAKAGKKRSPRAVPQPVAKAEEAPEVTQPAADVDPPDTDDQVDGVVPVVIGRRADPEPVEMVRIFEIAGEVYSIPKEPTAGLVLKYLFDLRQSGRDLAIESMAVTYLGEANFRALAQARGVSKADIFEVLANVGVVFFGSTTYEEIISAAGN